MQPAGMGVRCYSQRMLNPYHGIVNVVEVPGAGRC
jgi:hypothetical protein